MRRLGAILLPILLGLISLALAATRLAGAREGDNPSRIYACAGNSGALRAVASGQACESGEQSISWPTDGPAGAVGSMGPQGASGRAGTTGPVGAPGRDSYVYPQLKFVTKYDQLDDGDLITPSGNRYPYTFSDTIVCPRGGIDRKGAYGEAISGGANFSWAGLSKRITEKNGRVGPWQDIGLRSSYPFGLPAGWRTLWEYWSARYPGERGDFFLWAKQHAPANLRDQYNRFGPPVGIDGWHVRFVLGGLRPLDYPNGTRTSEPSLQVWALCYYAPDLRP